MIYQLTLPVPPSANRWWRKFRNMMVTSAEARAYKEQVPILARRQGLRERIAGDVRLVLVWFRERRSGDLDKRIGVLLDALQGTAYENDGQIAELHAYRFEDPKNPRVVVEVGPRAE